MKKVSIYFSILSLLIFILVYFIVDAKKKNDNFIEIKNHITRLIIINKDFDIYIKHKSNYENYDIIESKINNFYSEFDKIKNNINYLEIKDELIKLNKQINIKIKIIEKTKSYRAILNNSFRIIQILKKTNLQNKYNELYFNILSIDKNSNLNKIDFLKIIENNLNNITSIKEKYFLMHAKNILEYDIKIKNLESELKNLNIDTILNKIEKEYRIKSNNSFQKAYLSIIILFIVLIMVVVLYLYDERKLLKSYKELYKFRNTVENSNNIVIITDKDQKITYVNNAFTVSTKYTFDEVKGKTPKLLRSGFHNVEFYKNINNKIYNGEQWTGEFRNRSKDGEMSIERAMITPSFDEKGNIIEFISIKQDITREKEIQDELIKNEKLIIQQSKMAAMGEMLENIAHQWRQPLSTISTVSSGMLMKKELDLEIDKNKEIDYLNKIINTTSFLSKTIEDFRNFFKDEKVKIKFNVKDAYIDSLNIVNSKFESLGIKVIEDLDDIIIESFKSELMQVFINILNNAKDALVLNKIENKFIFIKIKSENQNVIISILDNANGIPKNVIDKIFEPYFTTKHKSQGTGIGLYMSSEIIEKHLNGKLLVNNEEYKHNNYSCKGAKFIIKLPIEDIDKKENNVK